MAGGFCRKESRTFISTIGSKYQDDFWGTLYIALISKPYVLLEEVADYLCEQLIIIGYLETDKQPT